MFNLPFYGPYGLDPSLEVTPFSDFGSEWTRRTYEMTEESVNFIKMVLLDNVYFFTTLYEL
jgi:hypothetical protein